MVAMREASRECESKASLVQTAWSVRKRIVIGEVHTHEGAWSSMSWVCEYLVPQQRNNATRRKSLRNISHKTSHPGYIGETIMDGFSTKK